MRELRKKKRSEMKVCHRCKKNIRTGTVIYIRPTRHEAQLGIGTEKVYHKRCYDAEEKAGLRELMRGVRF